MKKLLLAGLLSLFAFPSFAMAQVTPTADVDTVEQSSCINISNNLRYRTRDASVNNEVSDLQDFLNMKGYLKSGPTGYFGLATFNAVKKFQSASGFAPTGYVGSLTRAKISALTCGGVVETSAPTAISTPTAQVTTTPATLSSLPSGCTSTVGYSSLTGKRCLVPAIPTPTNLPAGCASTAGFSSVTGNACDGTLPPKPIYPSGCTSNSGWSSTTGQSCGATTIAPTVSLTAYPTTIALGQSSTLTLSSANAGGGCSGVLVTDGKTFGTTTVSPTQTTSYGVTCYELPYNGGRSASTKVTVSVVSATTTATAPTISSISPSQGSANTTVTIYGTNLAGYSTIEFYNSSNQNVASIKSPNSSNSTQTQFLIDSVTAGMLDAGTYQIRVFTPAYGQSNALSFTLVAASASAPTVEVIGTPTLSLQYDSAGKESVLVGKATVKITAGSTYISDNFGFIKAILGLSSQQTKNIRTNSMKISAVDTVYNIDVVPGSQMTIAANSSRTFSLIITVPTRELFAGAYTFGMVDSAFSYCDHSGSVCGSVPSSSFINNQLSNSVTIIGETAPYISSVVVDPIPVAASAGYYDLYGNRFHSTLNQVSINGITKTIPSSYIGPSPTGLSTGPSDNGGLIMLKLSDFNITTSGTYSLQISTSEGASNIVNVNVTVANSPTVTVISPNGGEMITAGKIYPLKWIIRNYPTEKGGLAEVILRNVNTGVETSITSAGIDNNNESWINWTVPTSVVPGPYDIRIYVVSNAKDLIIKDVSDAPFSIVAATTTATLQFPSQLAGVLGAFSPTSAPAPTSSPTPTWAYSWTRNLEVGSSYTDDIAALQTALSKEGVYAGEVTGGFYSQTYLAVKAFQKKYGIDSTGFVGPTTRMKLNDLY